MTIGPTLYSAQITDMNASPFVLGTAGESNPWRGTTYEGYVTAAAADAAGTIYKLVRVKTTVKVKEIVFESEAQGAGDVNLSLYYADAPYSPTTVAGTLVSGQSQLFASDIACGSAVKETIVTNESGNYTLAKRSQPLWQAAGLSSDPGGYFDICAVVHTADITTGTGKLGIRVTVSE